MDLWIEVIERHGATERTAREFYGSTEAAAAQSRAAFWEAVRGIIRREESATKKTTGETINKTFRRNQAATRTAVEAGKRHAAPSDGRKARKGRKTHY